MKNFVLLALIGLGCVLSSCRKDDDNACYVFTITQIYDINPDPKSEYPKTTVEEQEECDMSDADRDEYMNFFNRTRQHTIDSTIYDFITTCTYRKK